MPNHCLRLSLITKNIFKFGLCFFLFTFTVTAVHGASIDYTLEYQKSANFLDVINAKTAYDMGYTGAGVGVGVIDQAARTDHPELIGKVAAVTPYLQNGTLFIPDWVENFHGTHVSGIIAAKRDGIGMHGVAYNANLYSLALFGQINDVDQDMKVDFQAYFNQYPHVRIINNSWGASVFSYLPWDITNQNGDIVVTAADVADITAHLNDIKNRFPDQYQLAQIAMNNPDKVFVFAEGNDGKPAGTIEEVMPRHYGTKLNNWITVSSLNGDQITRDATGNLTLTPGAVAFYTNFVTGAERYSLSAPGSYIYSAYSGTQGYIYQNGTSMAAPVVSGALALVQEKFPWMTGKQLADTVLSTANDSFTPPDFTIQIIKTEISGSNPRYDLVFNYIEQTAPAGLENDKTELKKMVEDNYNDNIDTWKIFLGEQDAEDLKELIDDGQYDIINNVPKESIFGQGILDVGKAMGGIAQLDANRMTEEHVLDIPELGAGTKDAIMTLNTAGYNAEFSNDIEQFTWDDTYHHAEYKTTGITGLNDAARALDGKDIGIRKSGAGRLILSGDNTYAGATIAEGGELTIAKRANGTGGILQNSSTIVRSQGRLSGNGTIDTRLINSGIVAPGLFGIANTSVAGNRVLTVENYTQQPDGTLQIYFDTQGNHGQLNATATNSLAGKLMLSPMAGFYTNGSSYNIKAIEGVAPAGAFSSTGIEKISPTLNFAITALNINDYRISMNRAQDAYSQYAKDGRGGEIGVALAQIDDIASGDMQNLLTVLDFSDPTGQMVSQALTELSPETYDVLGQASLGQQGDFNNFIMQRMIAINRQIAPVTKTVAEAPSGIAAGDAAIPQPSYQVWGQVIGSTSRQGAYDDISGYVSSGVGFVTGIDYRFNHGLTAGMHAATSTRRTTALGNLDSNTDTDSLSLGLQAHLAPDNWDDFYIMGQARLGFEHNNMQRTVAIGSFSRTNNSEWTDFVGSLLLGGGKDWRVNDFTLGPLLWLEYSFMQRPEITEANGMSTRLKIEGNTYDSLRSGLGFHAGYTSIVSEKLTLDFDLMASWQHELLDGNVTNKASFVDYSNSQFSSEMPLLGRNTYGLQANIRLTHIGNYFAEFDIGGEVSDANGQGLYFGLKLGYNF